ncbi:MAG: 4Fe-4S binding protein [Rhodocyclales bacterium]|nr:4Fe-4S binding protein [Rhodocyclales bacterium]
MALPHLKAFMGTARLIGLAFLLLLIPLAQAAEWETAYPQLRGIFPDAETFGEFEGSPPSAPVYKARQLIGYVFLTNDVLRIPAYSGKPINTMVGIDTGGRIAGLTIVQHDEPILAVGITPERLDGYVAQYRGKSAFDKVIIGAPREGRIAVDGITGATITVMVINAAVMRSARLVAESRGIQKALPSPPGAGAPPPASAPQRASQEPLPASSPSGEPGNTVTRGYGEGRTAAGSAVREENEKENLKPAAKAGGQPTRNVAATTAQGATAAPFTKAQTATAPQGLPFAPGGLKPQQEEPEWVAIWKNRQFDIAVLVGGLVLLSFVLIFQDWLARDPTLLTYVRNGFHVYTLFFIGWWGLAQLSVINVLTFTGSVMSGFRWENFLIDPMMFILWGFVAMTLLLWGRGVYCGWLCPFGALQELILIASRKLKLPQFEFSDAVHERLVALKYIILILLFGISLQSISEAAWYAEVEPFKTVITMRFQREWNYVLYALILIGVAAVNRKFYCKYLCPLGAALAIPGRFRLFEWWLRRRKECGKPCQVCANQCSVRAIRQTGEINANECHYCLDCQVIYYNDKVCLPLIDRRKRREQQLVRGQENRVNSEAKALAVSGEKPDDMAAPGKH